VVVWVEYQLLADTQQYRLATSSGDGRAECPEWKQTVQFLLPYPTVVAGESTVVVTPRLLPVPSFHVEVVGGSA
jgi:hypothetical protein